MDAPVLLYDGLCGFCNGTVQFVLKHDADGPMRFAPLQGTFAAKVIKRHPRLASVDSLILVEHDVTNGRERIAIRSTSVLRIAQYLGAPWSALGMFYIVPRFIRDAAYDLFARFRYRVFGKHDSCPLPTAEERARFLE